MLTACGVDNRRSDPSDRDRMLFYLLIKKDGSTVLPAVDAVHPDFASASLPSSGESTPEPAAPAVVVADLQQEFPLAPPPSVLAAAEAGVQNSSHQAVPPSVTSAAQVSTVHSDQPAVEPSADALQQGLQHAAASEPRPTLSGSSSSLLHPSTSNLQACAPPQASLPAAPASPQLSHSSQLPQPLLPQLVPASPQLQPTLPQLQPAPPQPAAAMPHRGQPSSQQMHQHLPGEASQAAAGQDISKEFLALLQETSTHLAGSQPSWPHQAGSDPSIAQPQIADSMPSEAAAGAVEADGPRPSGAVTAVLDSTGPQVTSQSDEAQAGDQGTVSSHVFHLLILHEVSSLNTLI